MLPRTLVLLTALFIGFAGLMLANGLMSTLLALRMGIEGFTITQAGWVMSAYALGLMAAPWVVPKWIHRIGHIRFFTALAALAAAITLLHALVIDPVAWLLMRMITGFALGALFMVLESWLNYRTESAARGRVLSIYQSVSYLGLGGGQFLIKLFSPAGMELFVVAGILFTLAVIPVAITRLGEPDRPDPHTPPVRALWTLSPLGIFGAFCAGLISLAFIATGPLYARDLGMSADRIATFMGAAILSGLLLQLPMGWLSDRIDRRLLIAGTGLAVAVVAGLAIAATLFEPAAVVLAAPVFGGVAFTLYPLVASHANDVVAPKQSVHMAAGVIMAFGAGSVFGPLLATQAMAMVGPSGLFGVIAGSGILLGAFAVWRTFAGEAVAEEERGEFVPMAQPTPGVIELDPRTETGPAPLDAEPEAAAEGEPPLSA